MNKNIVELNNRLIENENEINLLNDKNKKLEKDIINLNLELNKNKNENKEDEINNKEQINMKIKNLSYENKSLKGKNLLLLQENTILKSVKAEFEKYKKNKEIKQEKIQYLIETNNFNFFYNKQNSKNNINIPNFTNLKVDSSIIISYRHLSNNENIEENDKYKNNYDKDEEINESELNLIEEKNEENDNINYDELYEDMNQEAYNENELYTNYENEGDKIIKKKKKRKRKKKNKSQINDNINNNIENDDKNIYIKTNSEQNKENIKNEHLSQSQKKKKKMKRKLDNMKSNYLSLLEIKENLFQENQEQKQKIKDLEILLEGNNLDINNNINNVHLNNQKEENIIKNDKDNIIIQLKEKILVKDKIIEELKESITKIEKEYKLSLKQIISMKELISNLEKNQGIEDQMNKIQKLITQKEEQIIILTDQLKEYQSKCYEIIMGKTLENKDEQITLLLNEVKSVRSKIKNILTFEGRITDYEEFMGIMLQIKKYFEKNENEEIKVLYEKLKHFLENYELNGQKFYNKILQEIF